LQNENGKMQNANFAEKTIDFSIFNLIFTIHNSFQPILQTAKMLRLLISYPIKRILTKTP